jgi:hypothetical protein
VTTDRPDPDEALAEAARLVHDAQSGSLGRNADGDPAVDAACAQAVATIGLAGAVQDLHGMFEHAVTTGAVRLLADRLAAEHVAVLTAAAHDIVAKVDRCLDEDNDDRHETDRQLTLERVAAVARLALGEDL